MEQVVQVEYLKSYVALVKIHRPEAKNALNTQVRIQLAQIFNQLSDNPEIRAIVLTGGEQDFAAGADLKELANAHAVQMMQRRSERYWQAIASCPKPVIAAVNGYALGGGCELAMHADIIIASQTAVFGQPEVKVGVMPGAGGTQRLFRAVGKFQAMRMILTGCLVPAQEALQMGLVSQLVEEDNAIPAALKMAESIAKLPPVALEQIKEVALMAEDVPLHAGLALERKSFQLLFDTEDQKEGMQAFIEKRKPNYQGK
ncbi:enoyl-CoA hydratase [Acinetobacter radioresistens]|uniref:enoyl-CoA hydratase n=1 Tax=Acinetobacter radioresistens TaxID=40216 RepID=UPI00125F65E7|nr:enoyl-CoA hydratase [Acinetobacter radioresistens]